ncbi:hypothetical protein Gasu2_44140 [Galdieria sulphuraria]|nr:hypothetical protein Gasu2_44140 [Galdieria sulphuraria]
MFWRICPIETSSSRHFVNHRKQSESLLKDPLEILRLAKNILLSVDEEYERLVRQHENLINQQDHWINNKLWLEEPLTLTGSCRTKENWISSLENFEQFCKIIEKSSNDSSVLLDFVKELRARKIQLNNEALLQYKNASESIHINGKRSSRLIGISCLCRIGVRTFNSCRSVAEVSTWRKLSIFCGLNRSDFSLIRLPESNVQLVQDIQESCKSAICDGLKLLEVQFPPLKNIGSAALNQVMDANRTFAKSVVQRFPHVSGNGTTFVVFPDDAESKLAREDRDFRTLDSVFITSLQRDIDLQDASLVVILNPGFQVQEWFEVERFCNYQVPVILFNADLDKLRGGYYPRFLYPKLYATKDKCLTKFEPVYYVRFFVNGALIRRYPNPWQIVYEEEGCLYCILERNERPDFQTVRNSLNQFRR